MGGHGVVLADRRGPDGGAGPLGGAGHQALGLTGDAQSGGLAEAEVGDLAEEPGLAQALGDLDGPDVGRLGEDLGGGHRLGAVLLGVVERVLAHRQGGRDRQRGVGVTTESARAAENVTSLNTEPGS